MLKLRTNGGQASSLLHSFRRLSLSSTSSANEATYSFTEYLVHSLGFSKQQASSLSTKLTRGRLSQGSKEVSDSDSIPKADSVIGFLKQNGFDESQIRTLVCFHPRVLRSSIGKTLKPKIDFLRSLGLAGPDLVQVVTVNPAVLIRSLGSDLPAMQVLRELLGADENLISLLQRLHRIPLSCLAINLVPNIGLLQSYGIPIELIRKRVLKHPFPYLRDTKYFEDMLIRVEEKLGIRRDSLMFLYGVQLLGNLSEESIDSKCQVFKSFGWTESEIRDIVRKHPTCFSLSEARIKKSLEFFMNELGYKPAFVASCAFLLTYSLEKRIMPRHRVMRILKEKGLIRKDYSLSGLVTLKEALFMKRFVLPFKEVHKVYAKLSGCPLQQLTQGKADSHSQT